MNERQVVVLHHDGTDLVGGTAVDALAGLNDHGAHGLLLELLERHGDLALPSGLLLLGELGADGLLQSLDLTDTGELVGVAKGGCHLVVVGEDALWTSSTGWSSGYSFLTMAPLTCSHSATNSS